MRPNIGRVDALCRITAGFTLLAWATAKLARNPSHSLPLLGAVMGGMKVAEGITRFCPLVYVAEQRNPSLSHEKNVAHQQQADRYS
ncbi:DUF2892 domain-containing protein [Alkalihalobacillus oceani]|uniref:DUF2892 domain-containing protein n=1 Tax=Halalkalibacter oceani TaxID=1653776 RepID=A0A9X2DST7_9BACI|nr:DUF2892 domain-containing protein [Halalkalibacter oceani]MCM3715530.1 DUF2892 domain-containing protein [Halalkalibacter oceani]